MMFAKWLDEQIMQRDLSGRELAEALEVRQETVSRWRTGRNEPVSLIIPRLATYFGVSPEDIENMLKGAKKV